MAHLLLGFDDDLLPSSPRNVGQQGGGGGKQQRAPGAFWEEGGEGRAGFDSLGLGGGLDWSGPRGSPLAGALTGLRASGDDGRRGGSSGSGGVRRNESTSSSMKQSEGGVVGGEELMPPLPASASAASLRSLALSDSTQQSLSASSSASSLVKERVDEIVVASSSFCLRFLPFAAPADFTSRTLVVCGVQGGSLGSGGGGVGGRR